MKVLVTGGRDFYNKTHVWNVLNEIHEETPITLLIHGNARGADTLAHQWAMENGIKTLPCPAQWDKYGKGAGPIRNALMLSYEPKLVIAFKGGKGTRNMVNIAKKAGVVVFESES